MAQQQQQPSGDHSMAPVWITALLFITVYLLWVVGHEYIVRFIFFLNIWQIKLISLVVNRPELIADLALMETVDPSTIQWQQLVEFTEHVGLYMRYPILMVLVVFSVVLYRSDITLRYRKIHSMNSLREQEQQNWPGIMPIAKQDLVSVDINVGPWAMAQTPIEFARHHHLLKKNDALLDGTLPGLELTAGIRSGDAKRIFTLQLGPVFDGFERCPPHAQAMAAVFMARMNRDKSAANHILTELNRGCVEGKMDFSVATPTLARYQHTELVQEVVERHAYQLTVLASLLLAARDDGVVPTSEFLWLKTIDRRLWYMLNCVGRQTPFSEVGGAFAHWRAEREMKRPSVTPMIDEAIRALEIAVREVKLSPKELRELKP